MNIFKLQKDSYGKWDRFCEESDEAWFWMTTDWQEYTLNYRPQSKPEMHSFYLEQNKQIFGICCLLLETTEDGVKEFSYGGGYLPTPAFKNGISKKQKQKFLREFFQYIDSLAKERNVKRVRMKIPILDNSYMTKPNERYNFLMEFGFLCDNINTQIIDLNKPIKELRGNVRHGHDADITRAGKFMTAEVFDRKNITKETFDLMFKWIKEGKAFLIGANKDRKFVGFSYFNLYKNNAYYSSACNDPDEDLPIAHLIQWKAIEWMHSQKVDFYEIGWLVCHDTLSDYYSTKEVQIGHFKKGFGGYTVPLFLGDKYYDGEYFHKIYEKKISRYRDYLAENNQK